MPSLVNKLNLTRPRLIGLGVVLIVAVAALIFWMASLNRRIEDERDQLRAASRVEVKEARLRAPATDGFTLYANSAAVRATVQLNGTRYLATAGGLVALDEGDSIKRRYTTLDGLPENDLTTLAVFRGRLFIGTTSAGLLAFDGSEFTHYQFEKPKATRVSVLVATASELIVGTLDGGVFEYDGERFSRRFNATTGADFSRVTALLAKGSRLYIGTQNQGLYVWREAQIVHLSTNEGLPSTHVTALAAMPDELTNFGSVAVATDFGVVGADDDLQIKPLSTQPNITSLVTINGKMWAGLFGGGLKQLDSQTDAGSSRQRAVANGQTEAVGLPRAMPTTLFADDAGLWALTEMGAFVRRASDSRPAFDAVASLLAGERSLTTGHIMSLDIDPQARLWIGYFDRGIDITATETGERIVHLEDERLREVNFIKFDDSESRTLVATSRGLIILDGSAKQTVLTRERNGLISDAVAHVALRQAASITSVSASAMGARDRAIVLATAGGLTEISGGRARSLSAFHGLASNHLYTSAAAGSRLYVGSLAGLIEMDGLRVVHAYKTSNSKLSHDWVTALAEDEGTLYIGTNGGGVDALLATGEWLNFADQLGAFEVNQNAMHKDGEQLYVGTTDRGLLVYNTRARRWSRISAGLPSPNVTAITSDDHFVYVGTLNGLLRIEKRVME